MLAYCTSGAGPRVWNVGRTRHLVHMTAEIHWSEREPAAAVSDLEQLDERLDSIASKHSTGSPTIVEVCAHQQVLTLGLGLPESFVQIKSDSNMPPYLVTVGDGDPDGVVTFYFMGNHHTEIPRRHLISASLARDVVRDFFNTGQQSNRVEWEEI